MPLYEYRCTQCGNRYEKIQKMSEAPDTACPKCGGKVERPLTAPALQFKGSGWYINDYASKPAGGSSKSESSSQSDTKSSESKSSESKASESKPASSDSSSASASSGSSNNSSSSGSSSSS